ncbi:hypothetical protein CVT24_010532 [Panaeolus cyanescens]|uniref:Protein transport protein sec16 n=1 Tax=Panaeolus cyanescens TaxID=181874 RepID=A0A409YYI5_9AGAR|nr:hypothetical protein CVT24_010532 [Panaeolus cyanescens]
MSGVEAAASLFGGTDSEDRDLFATLGSTSDSASPENDDNNLFNSSSHFLQDQNDFFDSTPQSQETSQPLNNYQNTNSSTVTSAASTYDPYWSQQSTHPTSSVQNAYTPSSYSTPTTQYPSYNPSSYAPPTSQSYAQPPIVSPATTAQPPVRSPYDPPASQYQSAARYGTSSYDYPANVANTPSNYPAPKAPPAAPAVAPPASLNRPKISNAYDPPFLPSTSSRKAGRSVPAAHNIYAQQQTPTPLPPPPPQRQYSQTYAPPHNAPIANNPIPPERPPSQNYSARYSPIQTSTHAIQSPYDVKTSTHPPSLNGQHISNNQDIFADIHAQYHPAEPELGDAVSNGHGGAVDEPASSCEQIRPPSVPLPAAQAEAVNLSPSLVPLPYSPPMPQTDLYNQAASSNRVDQVQNYAPPPPHASQQSPPKKDPSAREVKESYVPKLPYNTNNYIPRTSSPLSLYSGTSQLEQKPVSAPSHLNGVRASPYDPPPRSTIGSTSPYVPPTHSKTLDAGRPPRLDQTRLNPPPTVPAYAPSPSLLGTNDPLSRTSAHAPIITFGFGGKVVTCFHRMAGMNAGFDVALSSRPSSEIKVYTLHKLLPESVLHNASSFPGPLVADPGASSLSLVRVNQATQAKAKKAALITYLTGRALEIEQGLGYLSVGDRQRAEGKRTLINLLKIMIENDGKLLGTIASDLAIRQALVPRLESVPALQDGMSLQASHRTSSVDERPISTTILRASALDKIEEFLLQGERRQAYHYAADEKLWAHALIIASSIDKESWKEVVSEFLRSELTSSHGANSAHQPGRESLKVAYSLFSGQGAAAVQELSSPTLLQKATLRPPVTLAPSVTPRTPNFSNLAPPAPQVSEESLQSWAETAAMLISSPLSQEASAALTALGDQLMGHNFVEAAHSCYLLSPQTSLVGGLGSPNTRITLLGAKYPGDAMRDSDTIILSEIWEFALSLASPAKGQDAFHGLAHLQAYRLLRAAWLAEIGEVQLAGRYCEAITASITQNSPYTTFSLMHHLQGLQQQLSGVFHDKSGSWIGGKLTKPSLDSISGWIEGRFTKLVTGDADSPSSEVDVAKPTEQTFAGPFAHYSTISSTVPSARSSPQPRPPQQPPQRTSSAMATPSYYAPPAPVERSSSALGYMGQKSSPTLHAPFSHTAANGHGNGHGNGYASHGYGNGVPAPIDTTAAKSDPNEPADTETPVQTGGWWESAGFHDTSKTPTAATFVKLDEAPVAESADGFISLMDEHPMSFGASPSPVASNYSYKGRQDSVEEDEEDLGFGNSKPKPKVETETEASGNGANSSGKPSPAPSSPVEKPAAAQPANTGGWLSRWWKGGGETSSGPVKASLGEESAFYYDKEQKRWVNKKAGADDTPKPTPPPPPSRPQTASPGFSGPKAPPAAGPPPPRSSSAIDLSTEPPTKVPMRIRSNLAPPTESAPSTPTGTRHVGDGPPPSRPRSQASKRSVRSRYVDVFQQEGNGSS